MKGYMTILAMCFFNFVLATKGKRGALGGRIRSVVALSAILGIGSGHSALSTKSSTVLYQEFQSRISVQLPEPSRLPVADQLKSRVLIRNMV